MIQARHPTLPLYDKIEFEGLAKAAGYYILKWYTQNIKQINSKLLIGTGKLEEIIHNQQIDFGEIQGDIATRIERRIEDDLVYLFMNRLKPSQIRNLSAVLMTKVIDRDLLILEIFERNASTREAQIQIKLARLNLETSRIQKELSAKLKGEKQGRDFKGRGYGAFDVYRRGYKEQRKNLVEELESIRKQRDLRRKARSDVYNVSIVGYTSAGKTTLLNSWKGLNLKTDTSPFTTVSTTTRNFSINGDEMTISDSVGFVYDIPHEIIDAFLSTLEEVVFSDCIILMVDFSDPLVVIFQKLQTTFKVLVDIGALNIPVLYFMNKTDIIPIEDFSQKRSQILEIIPKNAIVEFGSAFDEDTIERLSRKLYEIKNSLVLSTRVRSQEFLNVIDEKIKVHSSSVINQT